MNYFAHGYRFLDDPYFLAGTAIPDWMNVVDRRTRVRPKAATVLSQSASGPMATVARGVLQHFHDDGWFHRTPAFSELCWQFTVRVRDAIHDDGGMRPSFLGHILVEILLDATLVDEHPEMLDAYYAAVLEVDPAVLEETVDRMAPHPPPRWGHLIERFVAERFLADYLDDERLLFRLNQVMRRVGLSELGGELLEVFPSLRADVTSRQQELLTPNE